MVRMRGFRRGLRVVDCQAAILLGIRLHLVTDSEDFRSRFMEICVRMITFAA